MESIIKDFKKLFEAEKISLAKVGNAFVVSVRKYDVSTGEEVNADIFALDQTVLEKLKTGACDLVDNVDFALAEIAKL